METLTQPTNQCLQATCGSNMAASVLRKNGNKIDFIQSQQELRCFQWVKPVALMEQSKMATPISAFAIDLSK